jgi:predicted alpha/beta superfamily hydrolase
VFAMLHEPKLFRNYVAGSPSFWIGDKSLFNLESTYAKSHKSLPAQLYMGLGEAEESPDFPMVTEMLRFAAQLESRNYKRLSLTKQVFLDYNHCEVVAPAFQAGLRLALRK